MKFNILLFDIDNVLVEPRAYQEAIVETLKSKNFPKSQIPSVEDINLFESIGIHDVWDITTIIYANALAKRKRYSEVVNKLAERVKKGEYPPAVAFDFFSENLGGEKLKELKDVLSDTRDPYKNELTRIFQEIVVGSKNFEKNYGLKPMLRKNSLLKEIDKVLINEKSKAKLREINENSGNSKTLISIYTSRPGLGLKDEKGYSPEAEIAIEMTEMNYPLISMGSMQWLGLEKKEKVENLTKPDPTQALAAIVSSFSTTKESLESAYNLSRYKKLGETVEILKDKEINIYVFEDSPSGILAVRKAADILKEAGINASSKAIGIYRKSREKKQELEKICEFTAENINSGIDYVTNLL